MKIAVLGKDMRFACLAGLLRDRGHEIISSPEEAGLVIANWPPEQPLPGAKIVACGPKNAPDGIFDLLKDEKYQRNIAWMTAEGAIAAAMGRTGCAIKDAKCMVVGWGRIGSALAERLAALGAHVTVLSRRDDVRHEISALGAEVQRTCDAAEVIAQMRFVFSTPPVMVLDENVLKNCRKDAAIIDLATPPYGVDLAAAEKYGLNAWREPGIPGRYCPENAAQAIYDVMTERGLLNG